MRLPTPLPLRDSETDRVWVIVPLSRPENAGLVLENFVRQKFPFKRLVVVANGRAQDHKQAHELLEKAGAFLVTSEAHQSAAKNIGLAEVRKRGGGFTAIMDDDDYYGPQYLTEVCGYAKSYDVIGKGRHFVSVDGSLWLCSYEQRNRTADDWITGGTIACWAEAAPQYPMLRWGEDAAFCQQALRRGMRLRTTDIYHYMYRRESKADHAWRITHEQLRRSESARGSLDLGIEDLAIVNGGRLEVEAAHLASQEDIDTIPPAAAAGGA